MMGSSELARLDRENSSVNPSYKVLLVGGSGVGKTCLLRRYVEGEFPMNCKATLGLDFKIRTLLIGKDEIRLQLWDTSGQERFRSMTQAYYRGAAGIVLVYDVTAEDSFSTLADWLGDIGSFAPEDVKIMLIGNKCDDEEERVISKEAGEEFAKEHGLIYFETSAVTNKNVAEAFEHLASLLLKKEQKTPNGTDEQQENVVKMNGKTPKDKKSLCPC